MTVTVIETFLQVRGRYFIYKSRYYRFLLDKICCGPLDGVLYYCILTMTMKVIEPDSRKSVDTSKRKMLLEVQKKNTMKFES